MINLTIDYSDTEFQLLKKCLEDAGLPEGATIMQVKDEIIIEIPRDVKFEYQACQVFIEKVRTWWSQRVGLPLMIRHARLNQEPMKHVMPEADLRKMAKNRNFAALYGGLKDGVEAMKMLKPPSLPYPPPPPTPLLLSPPLSWPYIVELERKAKEWAEHKCSCDHVVIVEELALLQRIFQFFGGLNLQDHPIKDQRMAHELLHKFKALLIDWQDIDTSADNHLDPTKEVKWDGSTPIIT